MLLLLSVLACKKNPEVVHNPVDTRVTTPAHAATPLTERELQTLADNFSRVHFALDSSTLDEGSTAALTANAEILRRHPEVRVEVQGHADERGTVDYNLALGQRRAQTVVRYLTTLGVAPSRLSITSFGEERPLAEGAGEHVWATNRRAEFRVLAGTAVRGTVQ